MKRVLTTFAGGNLSRGISRALYAAPEPIYIIGTDSAPFHLHQAEANERHLIPKASDPDFIGVLAEIAERTDADYIWPMHDAELARIANSPDELPAPSWVPSTELAELCRNKMKTFARLKAHGVPVPESMKINSISDLETASKRFGPLWLRALSGAGSKGAFKAETFEKAVMWLDLNDGWGEFMAAEPLAGPNDLSWEAIWKDGALVASQSKTRLIRGTTGISIPGVQGRMVVRHDAPQVAHDVALQAVKAMSSVPDGIFRVDMMANADGVPCVTEVDAGRFGMGGMAYWHEYGFNFPYQALRIALGEPIDYGVPVINPNPKDIIAISGTNCDMVFVHDSEIDLKNREFEHIRRSQALSQGSSLLSAGR